MVMKNEIIRRLENTRGDDLERAERAFQGENLTQEYGMSGRTFGEILEGYRAERARLEECIEWVRNLP